MNYFGIMNFFIMKKQEKNLFQILAFKSKIKQSELFNLWINKTVKSKSEFHLKFYNVSKNKDSYFILKNVRGILDFLSIFKDYWEELEKAIEFRNLLFELNERNIKPRDIKYANIMKFRLSCFLMETLNINKNMVNFTLKKYPNYISYFYYPFIFYYDMDNILYGSVIHKNFKKNFKDVLEF